jgi:hypothetical protein
MKSPFAFIRCSRALDSGKAARADKDQALVHAALRDAASSEVLIDGDEVQVRSARVRAIMHRVHEAGAPAPLPWWQARRGLLAACCVVLACGSAAAMYVRSNGQTWRLESLPLVRSVFTQKTEKLADQSDQLMLTDDAMLALVDSPKLAPGERWMSERPSKTPLQMARQEIAGMRGAQAHTMTVARSQPLMDPDLAREALALRAQLDQAAETVLSRLPGQAEPK